MNEVFECDIIRTGYSFLGFPNFLSWLSYPQHSHLFTYTHTHTGEDAIESLNKQAQKCPLRTSLVEQWIRIQRPVEGTQVWSLVQEDSTYHGESKPMYSWNYCPHSRAHELQLPKPACREPERHSKRSHRSDRPVHLNQEWPLLTSTRESPPAAMKTQCNQK